MSAAAHPSTGTTCPLCGGTKAPQAIRCRGCYGTSRVRRPLLERFMEKVEQHDTDCPCCEGCWWWTGYTQNGYGRFTVTRARSSQKAHRVAYELLALDGATLVPGAVLHHVCENTRCVNPAHLEIMAQSQHAMLGASPPAENGRKTHCPKGHEYTPENTVFSVAGWRGCVTCRRERSVERAKWRRTERHARRPELAERYAGREART